MTTCSRRQLLTGLVRRLAQRVHPPTVRGVGSDQAVSEFPASNPVHTGVARIHYGRCYQANGQPCDYCVTCCPLKEKAIGWDERQRPRIVAEGCDGCGRCAYLCPAGAITI